ncbi:MAG: methyltransferase domain-containing protein [Nitrospirae bacterium]|nr:methyltransferase domain-containing protein [Nitrospirota bacterium]NTW64892.1 methyltransferase domain-containing protein [Nitrospirota bacterium]
MEKSICPKAATVGFWDGYARWYRLWIEHTRYHDIINDMLMTMVEPGWKVFDIGAGNGILSLPLCAIGCEVTALEPSTGMRSLLYEQAFVRGIDWITVDDRKWEDIPVKDDFRDMDLVLACNSMHLTGIGFDTSLEKAFYAEPKRLFLATELTDRFSVKIEHNGYDLHFAKYHEVESSFAYHDIDQAWEHAEFKKGRELSFSEQSDVHSRLSFRDGHYWVEDRSTIGMFWWERRDR